MSLYVGVFIFIKINFVKSQDFANSEHPYTYNNVFPDFSYFEEKYNSIFYTILIPLKICITMAEKQVSFSIIL